MVNPERDDLVLKLGHLCAFVVRQHDPCLPPMVEYILRCRRERLWLRYMIDPTAVLERDVRIDVVRLPECACIGRHRPAADAHLVPDDPRHDEERSPGEERSGCEKRAPRY